MIKKTLSALLLLAMITCGWASAPVIASGVDVSVTLPYNVASEESFLSHNLLTHVVAGEAGHEPWVGRIAVAGVVIDRMDDERWPSTVAGVLLQKAQFTFLWEKKPGTIEPNVLREARIATEVAERGVRPCGQGVYWYHADYIAAPLWTKKLTVACHIGHHIFYKD